MCVQADTDLAMVMLESSSNASEAASRLGSIRTNAEASKLASPPKAHTSISICILYAIDQIMVQWLVPLRQQVMNMHSHSKHAFWLHMRTGCHALPSASTIMQRSDVFSGLSHA